MGKPRAARTAGSGFLDSRLPFIDLQLTDEKHLKRRRAVENLYGFRVDRKYVNAVTRHSIAPQELQREIDQITDFCRSKIQVPSDVVNSFNRALMHSADQHVMGKAQHAANALMDLSGVFSHMGHSELVGLLRSGIPNYPEFTLARIALRNEIRNSKFRANPYSAAKREFGLKRSAAKRVRNNDHRAR
ncbi:MAG TPA: hypothetical protein VJG83_05995 [archaeon]|nr:hypothetical protein [archaeon]